MLTLHPSPLPPVTRDANRGELVQIWDNLDLNGRRMLLAQARAVAELTKRVPRKAPEKPNA